MWTWRRRKKRRSGRRMSLGEIPREGRLVGAPPLGLGKPEELPSKPRGW